MQIIHTQLNTSPDVLIIGAGAAGIGAMAGAARAGATVTLLEKSAFGGGKATAAYVGTLCGLWYRSEDHPPRWVHDGFPKQFAEKLQEMSDTRPGIQKGGLHYLPYDHASFVMLCDSLIREHTKSVCFHATVTGAVAAGRRIAAVTAVSGGKRLKFTPATVVDASGEALFAQYMPMDRIISDRYQAAAQVFGFDGVAPDEQGAGNLSLIRSIRQAVASGDLPSDYEKITIVPGSWRNGKVFLKLAIPMEVNEDPMQRSAIELFARSAVQRLAGFLKERNELFKNATLSFIAPEAGIRTGPRYMGRDQLTEQQVLHCARHENAIARGAWPIEHWEPGNYAELTWFAADDHYDITPGMLRSPHFNNFYFAGRNLSADDRAIASARVIGTCLATGYAAGVLAAGHSMDATEYASISKTRQELGID
jgi:hypothetical protein